MRLLPDPVRRPAEARLRGPLRTGPGPLDRHPRRRLRQRAASLRRRLPGRRRPAMRLLHAGLVLRIKWITDQGERLSRARVARLLDGHLCRCTGYAKIVDAVELIQEAKLGRRSAAGSRRGRRRRQAAPALPGRRTRARASGRSSPTSTRPACSTGPSSCPRTRARESCASTSRRRWRCPGSPGSRPPPTFRATAGSARSTPTGRSSSPRARRRATSATCWRRSPPRSRASPARPRRWSRSNTSR